MLNAVRDNPERVEFIGYNTQRVRYFAFIIAGFFAGIAGGMCGAELRDRHAPRSSAPARSGAYLLFTFLGGATFFFGPIIGAVLMVLGFVLLSEITKAWLLYLGLVFLFMVMYAPGGIASLIMMNLRVAALRQAAAGSGAGTALLAATALVMLAGVAALIEMIYHLQLNSAGGPEAALPRPDARHRERRASWLGAAVVAAGRPRGCSRSCAAASRAVWGAIQERDRGDDDQRAGRRVVTRGDDHTPLELKDLRKSFGKTEIIRGADLAVARRRARRDHRPERRRQVDAVQPDQRPLRRRPAARSCCNGQRIDGLKPFEINRLGLSRSFQITNIFRQLVGVREPALRRALVAGLPLRVLEVPGRPERRQRARRAADGT